MRCMICNNNFVIKKNLANLFSTKNYKVCDSCYNKYKININYNVLPLKNYKLIIYSLFSEYYYFKNDPFQDEFSRLYTYVFNKAEIKDNILVYFNLRINDYSLKTFTNLSELVNNDIIIVCNYCEI